MDAAPPTQQQLNKAAAYLMLAATHEQQRNESASHKAIDLAALELGITPEGDRYFLWGSARAIIELAKQTQES